MAANQYDVIIIGARRAFPSPLAPLPGGEGTRPEKTKPLLFTGLGMSFEFTQPSNLIFEIIG